MTRSAGLSQDKVFRFQKKSNMNAKIVELQAQVVALEQILLAILRRDKGAYHVLGDAETAIVALFKENDEQILQSNLESEAKRRSLGINKLLCNAARRSVRSNLQYLQEKSGGKGY